jgi:crossover junction endodeoxyribonuclease RusA
VTAIRHIRVHGTPKPKGSLRHVGRGRLIEQVNNGAWKTAVTLAAAQERDLHGWETLEGVPLEVWLVFYIPPVASAPKRVAPITRSSGDLDKLTRLVLDCLTEAHIIDDDSLVTRLRVTKVYGDEPGASISVGVAP